MSLLLSEPLFPTCAWEHHPDSSEEEGSWGFTEQSCSSNPASRLSLAQPCTPAPPGLLLGYPTGITHSPSATQSSGIPACYLPWLRCIAYGLQPGTRMKLGEPHCPGPPQLTNIKFGPSFPLLNFAHIYPSPPLSLPPQFKPLPLVHSGLSILSVPPSPTSFCSSSISNLGDWSRSKSANHALINSL